MSRKRLNTNKRKEYVIKPKAIILGDGPTEKDYVERLKELAIFSNINLKYEKGNEENFLTKLKEHTNNSQNVLLILDIDNSNNNNSKKHEKIKRIIKEYKIQVFYNNYSFETWLINHKKCFGKPIIASKEYDLDFQRCFKVKSWSKNKDERNRKKVMGQITKNNIKKASKNIKTISENHWSKNPSSNMDKFIECLKNKTD